jgi:hypothetical protein
MKIIMPNCGASLYYPDSKFRMISGYFLNGTIFCVEKKNIYYFFCSGKNYFGIKKIDATNYLTKKKMRQSPLLFQ